MVQMLGWFKEDAALASRWKRLRACRIMGEFVGKELQGDVATELEVFRPVHYAHAAAAALPVGRATGHILRVNGGYSAS
jgi:hypothetical protein